MTANFRPATAALLALLAPRWHPRWGANDEGDTALVISESTTVNSPAQVRLYLLSELAPMPAPPAPRNVVSYWERLISIGSIPHPRAATTH